MKPREGFIGVLTDRVYAEPWSENPTPLDAVLVIPRSLATELEVYLSATETDAEGKELLAKLKERA
jgi:hypothetical protein